MRSNLRPLHRLLFGEAPTDHEVDGGFHEGGRDPLAIAPAFAVGDDRRGVVGDVGGQSGGRLDQPLQPGIGGVQSGDIRGQPLRPGQGLLAVAMPEPPLDPLQPMLQRQRLDGIVVRQAPGVLLEPGQPHGDVSGKEIALLRSPPLRTVRASCPAHGSSLRGGGRRSPAARSTRSWFRLTGGFRHPSVGLFSLRCLTSPSVEASRLIAPLRPAGSLRPCGLGIPALAALSPPLQRSLRFFRHPLPPPPSPSLRSGYRGLAATGRVGFTLLSNVEKRMGRLRPIVRRVLVPPSSRVPIDDPTRMPFWPRPVSTFGRLWITDLDHGRSLAFSPSSSAGPPPDWCSQIVAVVPEASRVGLLLRMSG